MIYEFRTYTIVPRSLPEVLKRFGDAIEARQKISPLAAFWYTEIGPLNQIIHVWPYESALERTKLREAAVKSGGWPPKVHDYLIDMQSEILTPLPYSPPLAPCDLGPIYEMRSYTLKPGGIPDMAARWKEALPERTKISPLAGVFTSEIGALNKWVHIWPYKSLQHREETRKAAIATGKWPPGSGGPSMTIRQENKIMLPAPFSPMK